MKPVFNAHGEVRSVAIIGNYLPRMCGIATFTTDLVQAISARDLSVDCWAVAMNDRPEGYAYPDKVRFEINQNKLSEYSTAADAIAANHADIVCVQHEYGIFGGPAGSHLLKLLEELRIPVVTTLHTVLKEPAPEYREVMLKLVALSDRLVVMSRKAVDILKEVYHVPESKISFIHHGIPDTPLVDSNTYKHQFGVDGKKVILTFGLLSPVKGIEYVLQALPTVKEKHPDIVYIILGATHPHVLKTFGEEYRIQLEQMVQQLDIADQVLFHDRFVENTELNEYLGCADLYVTPYLDEAQITSGTLAYAMGRGKAVISTPYWYATEMLADGRGVIVPFKDSAAMAEQITGILDNDESSAAMRTRAYEFTRDAVWSEAAGSYLEVLNEVKTEHARREAFAHSTRDKIKPAARFTLPKLKLDHMVLLTDDTGILQHAIHTVPNRHHGYCTDDNARALIAAAMAAVYPLAGGRNLDHLSNNYLGFLHYAFNPENSRFRNFMTYDREWMEKTGSEDSHGRALWGLGKAVEYLDHSGQSALAARLFRDAVPVAEDFHSPRALAFTIVGLQAYLKKYPDDSNARSIMTTISLRLFNQFTANAQDDWPWLEDSLNYANAKLPHALILAGRELQNSDMTAMGLKSLAWLLAIQSTNNHFSSVGNNGWYRKNEDRAQFDQQPIEAHAMVEACIEAYNSSGEAHWITSAAMCFNWFFGQNDLNMVVYDAGSGGCRDGLTEDGVNQNEGAESTLACILSHLALQEHYAGEIFKKAAT